MCALGCRCARHIFRQWQKECCHGNGILWQKWGEKSCVANYFFSFSPIWHRCLPWGVDVQDTFFFDSGRRVCCHGNGILWQKWGENLASRTTSSVFHQFSWNLAQMFALGCRCARHIFFWQWQKVCCHGNGILWQKWGENLARRELLPQFFTNSHEIWHRCLPWGVDVQDTFFYSGRKCVCHGNGILWQKWGGNLASRTTSSVFHQFSWNLAQMFALGCRCARHIFLTVAESVLPW